jgi:hypothetical protein
MLQLEYFSLSGTVALLTLLSNPVSDNRKMSTRVGLYERALGGLNADQADISNDHPPGRIGEWSPLLGPSLAPCPGIVLPYIVLHVGYHTTFSLISPFSA